MSPSGVPEGELRASALLHALSRFVGISSGEDCAGDPLRALVGEALSAIGALAGGIFMLDEARANLELKIGVNYPEPLADRYRLIPLSANVPLVDAVKRSTAVALGSLAEFAASYPEYAAAHAEIAKNAFVALPITVKGRCDGAIIFGFDAPRSFTSEERGYLTVVADQCANAIERAQRSEAEQVSQRLAEHASRRLERLHVFTSVLAQATTPPEIIETVLSRGLEATSAQASELWIPAPDGTSIVLSRRVATDEPTVQDAIRISLDTPKREPVVDAIRTGVAIWIESQSQLQERYPEALGRLMRMGERSFAYLPLLIEGRCIGCVTYVFNGVHRFLEDDRALLRVVSWHSAQALERGRLYAAEREAKELAERNQKRSDFIAHVGTLLVSSLEYSNILSDVARATVPRFADWCVLELADQRLRGTEPVASHADPSKVRSVLELRRLLRERSGFGYGISSVMKSGRSQLHRSLSRDMLAMQFAVDPELIELAAEVGVASALVVPLSARGQVLGVILLSRTDPAQPYDEQDLATAEELGRAVGLAVDNARLYKEARDADRLKDEFLAMLSHELRNPLAPILTALELMDRGGDQTFAEERALIARHTRHLAGLVEDLLDVASITHERIELTMERCELAPIIAAAVETARPLIEQRAHRLISTPEPGLYVAGDRARLTQAIANLLTNAAEYTGPGGVISIGAKTDGDEAMVRVRDSGVGIAPELLPRIFDLFVQGARGLDRSAGGLGVGLTVVQSIVRMHGGTVTAESAGVGQGSEFVIRLPCAELGAVAVAPRTAASAPRDRLRVLVVDDNRDAAELLGKALQNMGCTVLVVHDGELALSTARDFDPQLVLLDIGLPGLDGYEVARRLREFLCPATKIIAITGYGRASDRQRSQEAGFDSHIVKPLSLDTLERIVEAELALRPTRTEPN